LKQPNKSKIKIKHGRKRERGINIERKTSGKRKE
jgi:hypothetical protein